MPPQILPAGQHYGLLSHRWAGEGFELYDARYAAMMRFPTHGNELASLIFVTSGRCTKRIGAREVELTRGDMVFLPSALLHSDCFPEATTFLAAEVSNSVLERVRETGSSDAGYARLAAHDARDLGARLRRELTETDSASPLILESILLNAMGCAVRGGSTRRLRRPPWLSRVMEVLHERALEPLHLHDVAAEVGVHPGHLSREFRRFFGIVPGEYVRRLRIEFAAQQLTESDASLTEIALAAGFADQAHFSRAFRRATGNTPRAYRQLTSTKPRLIGARS